MNNTKARIKVPPLSSPSSAIVVSGQKNEVAMAVSAINGIYEDRKRRCSSMAAQVQRDKHRLVIGYRKSGLDEIFEKTGVIVEPPGDPDSEEFTLRGYPEDLGRALTMVYQRASKSVTEEVTAPQWLHSMLIGKKGTALTSLKEGCKSVS